MKHARRPVKARVIPPKIIQKYVKRIAALEPDIVRVLEEEAAEREIAKLENRANRMQNELETVRIVKYRYTSDSEALSVESALLHTDSCIFTVIQFSGQRS